MLLRGMVGGTMIAHGVRHGRTLDGTAGWFGSIGFRQPRLQAQLSAGVEVAAGTAIVAGAATPLSSSAVVGTMAVAYRTVHRPNGFFTMNEGWEHVGLLAASSIALSAIGPGRFSIDRLLGLDDTGTPLLRAAASALLGVGGAAVQLATFWTEPSPDAHPDDTSP
ncbi:DoxX family protein [uncultured Jatrophihabitans sp.]|uniref:DoxX family protein n=1 Tax=uncultured Jatrophihabitans sp. TaxID=1610747 RepID=UPI0035CA31CE